MKNSMCLTVSKIFFTIFLFFVLPNILSAQESNFVSTPATVSVVPNTTFPVVINVEIIAGNVDGAEIHLNFDPAVLQVNSVDFLGIGQLGVPLLPTPYFDNTNGTIDFAAGNLFGIDPTVSFDFVQINFEAIAEGNTTIAYGYTFPRETKISSGGANILGTASDIPVEVALPNEDPVASFLASPTTGTAELLVSVDASASIDNDGNIVTYDWNFGDGNTATGIMASNNYLNMGTYTITLTVTDDDGAMNSTTQNIVVDEVVITTYTIDATAGTNGTIDPLTATINAGANQTFTITADPGYEIEDVLVDGSSVGAVATYDFIDVQANATISASFSEIPPFQLCIASGSEALTALGRNFEEDNANTGPTAHPTRTNGKKFGGYNGPIAGTTPGSPEELLFQKEIYGGAGGNNPSFTHDIPVTNGFYQVDLYFAEVFHSTTGKRIFDVSLEGNLILDEYEIVDPVKDGIPTFQTAITRTYYVNVQDGSLQVGIGPASVDNGKLSGLCVTAVSSANVHPITNIGPLNFDVLATVAAPLNIVDANNDQLTVVFNGMPASLSYNPSNNQLEGTPTIAEAGTYTINAIISDGTSSPVTEEFELVINPPVGNSAPEITLDATAIVAEGGTLNVPLLIEDVDGDALTVTVTSISTEPNELQNNNGQGTGVEPYPFDANLFLNETSVVNTPGSYASNLTFTPTFGDGGSDGDGSGIYTITVQVDDGSGNSITQELALTVNDTDQIIAEAGTTQVEAESYDDQGNSNGGDGIGVEADGTGFIIGYTTNNDFAEYEINVETAGSYQIDFLMGVPGAAGSATGKLTSISSNGNAVGSFEPLGTGGFGMFNTQSVTVSLPAGQQTLRFDFSGGGFHYNLDYFNFTYQGAPDLPPTIAALSDVEIAEGTTLNLNIQVDDDITADPTASIIIYDKSVPGGTNNPFTPAAAITGYTFTDNGGGSFTLNWPTTNADGRSYEARLTANDGVNSPVEAQFTIDIAQNIADIIPARTFSAPLPWYTSQPQLPFTVNIENNGAQNLGWVDPGDFVEYLIEVPVAGAYDLEFFTGKGNPGPLTITVSEENGVGFSVLSTVDANQTGWQTYVSGTTQVTFTNSGIQTLRLDFSGAGGVNIRDFNFTPASDFAPVIDAIADIEVDEGDTVTVPITVTDDTVPAVVVTIEIFDKSEPGGTNNPFTPALAISGYTFTDNGGGNYVLEWNTASTDGRSYEARVTANDGVNTPVIETFTIDVAQDILDVILARTFANPLPWYGNSPASPFTVSIENAGNIGWVDPGEFVEYLIDVPAAGTYNLRVDASKGSNAGGNPSTLTISEDIGGFSSIGTLDIPNTGWNPFVTYNTTVTFSNPGVQKLRFDFGGSTNITEFEFTEISNAIPLVTIVAPIDNTNVTRGADVTLTATAADDEDGDISESLAWTSNDIQFSSTPVNGIGASITAQFVTPGVQTVRAEVTDSDGKTAFDEITINVTGPQVDITSPTDDDVVSSTDVTLEWTGTDVLFGLTEHYHIFVNPPDVNNIDTDTRISTASQIGQEFWESRGRGHSNLYSMFN